MKRATASLLPALVIICVALSACSEKQEEVKAGDSTRLEVMLDFYVNPDHVGLLMAKKLGYFEQAGLDVRLRVPSDPAAPIKQVASGNSDLAISYEPELITARSQGLPVRGIASIVDEPLTSLIWLPQSEIEEPADLSGRTVATAGIPYQADYLNTILDRAGVPAASVSQVSVGLGLLPALLGGRADAILGGFKNIEGVDLQQRGDDPTVIPVDRVGVPTYDELVLVASEDTIDGKRDELRLFISALAKGTAAAVERPRQAVQAVLEAGRGLDPALTSAQVDATLPVIEAPRTAPYGWMNPNEWANFAAWMKAEGLIPNLPSTEDLIYSELLPPAPKPR